MSARKWLVIAVALLAGWYLLTHNDKATTWFTEPDVSIGSRNAPPEAPPYVPPTAPPQPKQSEEFVYVTKAGAKIYSGPDEEMSRVATLKAGKKLLLVSRFGDWLYVQDPVSKKAGYISGNAVSYTPPTAKPKQPKKAPRLSDQAVKQALIGESIASYPGSCPCPYNTDRAGRSCGRRSAYSKPGGYSPLCYPADITAEMVEYYRQTH